MLDVNFAANSGAKIDHQTETLEGPALLDILKNMNDSQLAELEDELNFASFTGIFGPILSRITGDSNDGGALTINKTSTRAA